MPGFPLFVDFSDSSTPGDLCDSGPPFTFYVYGLRFFPSSFSTRAFITCTVSIRCLPFLCGSPPSLLTPGNGRMVVVWVLLLCTLSDFPPPPLICLVWFGCSFRFCTMARVLPLLLDSLCSFGLVLCSLTSVVITDGIKKRRRYICVI